MTTNSTSNYPVKLTGHTIARNGYSASQRAALAAMIILGEVEFVKPTHKQIAKLLGVSTVYIDRALKLDPTRREWVADGLLQLTQFQKAPTDTHLDRLVSAAGTERVWGAICKQL